MIHKELADAPEGSLKVQDKAGKIYYYHQVKKDGVFIKKYIEKKNIDFVRKLAEKGYYLKVKPLLERELMALETFDKAYDTEAIKDIYESMVEGRKRLVNPIRITEKEILRRWEAEEYEINQSHPENLIYKTENGEIVRSKSELIIANMLNRNKEHLRYKYERPLELVIYGEKKIIYPDFTVLNIHTGKITYWEHVGRLDDSKYAGSFVRKVNTYIDNGVIPGKDLFFTYETMENPMKTQHVLAVIDNLK